MLSRYRLYFVSLLLALLTVLSESFLSGNEGDLVKQIENNLEKELGLLQQEQQTILSNPEHVRWSALKGNHALVDSTTVLAWSNNEYLPDFRLLQDSLSIRLLQVGAGDLIILKASVSNSATLYSMLFLERRYPIGNQYLSAQWNKSIFGKVNGKVVNAAGPDGLEVNHKGVTLFKLASIQEQSETRWVSLFFGTAALAIFLLALVGSLRGLYRRRKYQTVFLSSLLIFLLLRLVMITANIPGRWVDLRIFSAQEFAASVYNASMADLFINAVSVLLLSGYVFFTYPKWDLTKHIIALNGWQRYGASSFFLLVALFSVLYPFLFIETIFNNSAITLDITQTLSTDRIRLLAWFSLLIGTLTSFLIIHVVLRWAIQCAKSALLYGITLLIAVLFFTGYFILEGRDYTITLLVSIPFFVILFVTGVNSSLQRLSLHTFLYIFISLAAFSIQGALSIRRFVEEERIESQFRFASQYLIDRDVMAEYLLHETAGRVMNDAFIQSRLSNPLLNKSTIREKVRQIYLSPYFDRFEIQIYLYSPTGQSFEGLEQPDFNELSSDVFTVSNTTEYDMVYFVRSAPGDMSKHYFVNVPIQRGNQRLGQIVLELSLKRVIPKSVFPELLVDDRFAEYFQNRDKSFAFVKSGQIITSFGDYNYERDFDFMLLGDPTLYKSGKRSAGSIHAGLEDDSGLVAIVTAPAYPLFYVFTNFSFFFVSGIVIIGLLLAVYGGIAWYRDRRIDYAAKIQLYIYGAFAIPLVLVAITTLNRVSTSEEDQMKSDYQARSRFLSESLTGAMMNYQEAPDSLQRDLENEVANRAQFSNVDITLYDTMGRQVVSSQSELTEKQLISGFINRLAWEQIFQQQDESFVLNEQIGSLQFSSYYVALKSPSSGKRIGALGVPFFESGMYLESTQINVLANILSVFTVIFILFSILSLLVVDSLTFPLRFITRTLSKTTLSGKNEPLDWKSNDEIGLMVKEYNRMVNNLERSKVELERAQKESAWREIAKQVAHEIKNPLTPMKLTLQQLELILQQGNLDVDKTKRSVNTLLTQVDILNDIASSFSTFARMPAPVLQIVEVVQLLKKSVNLFSDHKQGKVFFDADNSAYQVQGDEQLLSRIFSNIILNGLQSSGERESRVMVSIRKEDRFIVIQFSDNGLGIAREQQEKIFTPYFTTKKSGSGLGLAIAKQGIEQSGGEIWFTSEVGKGSTFLIRIPLV